VHGVTVVLVLVQELIVLLLDRAGEFIQFLGESEHVFTLGVDLGVLESYLISQFVYPRV